MNTGLNISSILDDLEQKKRIMVLNHVNHLILFFILPRHLYLDKTGKTKFQ